MVFHALTFCRRPGFSTSPEISGKRQCIGIFLSLLLHKFNISNLVKKWHYILSSFGSQRVTTRFFFNFRLPGPIDLINRSKLAAIIRFDFDVSKLSRQGGCCTAVVVQRYKFINKKEKGLPLHS